jgi:predicted N-formylglutamate amidohydrolase
MIEIRNDLVRSEGEQGKWAARIAGPLSAFAPVGSGSVSVPLMISATERRCRDR